MPIALTTPFDPGDFDAVASYGEVEIAKIEIDLRHREIVLTYEWGNTVGEDWVAGSKTENIRIPVANWATIINVVANTNEKVGPAVKRACYNYLINNGYIIGTVN